MSFEHVMIDLETLGKTALAPVVEIGLVEFNLKGEIGAKYHALVEPNFKYSKPCFETIQWWMSQRDEVRAKVFQKDFRITYHKMLNDIQDFFVYRKESSIWCHATFDAPIIENLFKSYGHSNMPWKYNAVKDIRTLTFLAPEVKTKCKGMHHTAIDDCLTQIDYVCAMIKTINCNNN